MAFVRAAPAQVEPEAPQSDAHWRDQLASADAETRRRAARALARNPEAANALATGLEHEADGVVRHALFSSLIEIGGARVADLLGPMLRSEDAGLRGGAIEALKRLGAETGPVLDTLLSDPDPDVRILAIEVTRAWPAELAVPRLRRIIEDDPHVNVCAAAVDVATEVGAQPLVAALVALRLRFADQEFLVFAIDVACPTFSGLLGRDT
jgi:HEAT repeat protein